MPPGAQKYILQNVTSRGSHHSHRTSTTAAHHKAPVGRLPRLSPSTNPLPTSRAICHLLHRWTQVIPTSETTRNSPELKQSSSTGRMVVSRVENSTGKQVELTSPCMTRGSVGAICVNLHDAYILPPGSLPPPPSLRKNQVCLARVLLGDACEPTLPARLLWF